MSGEYCGGTRITFSKGMNLPKTRHKLSNHSAQTLLEAKFFQPDEHPPIPAACVKDRSSILSASYKVFSSFKSHFSGRIINALLHFSGRIIAAKLHFFGRTSKFFANFLGELYSTFANFLGELQSFAANFMRE